MDASQVNAAAVAAVAAAAAASATAPASVPDHDHHQQYINNDNNDNNNDNSNSADADAAHTASPSVSSSQPQSQSQHVPFTGDANTSVGDISTASLSFRGAGGAVPLQPPPPFLHQPPPPVEQTFNTIEDAKSYLFNYMAHTNTKLVIYRSNKQRGTINYRCVLGGFYVNKRLLNDDTRRRKSTTEKINCGFKVFIKYDKYENVYHLTVPYPYHSHPIVSYGNTGTNTTTNTSMSGHVDAPGFALSAPSSNNNSGLASLDAFRSDYRRPTEVIELIYEYVHKYNITDFDKIKQALLTKFPKLSIDDVKLQMEINAATQQHDKVLNSYYKAGLGVGADNAAGNNSILNNYFNSSNNNINNNFGFGYGGYSLDAYTNSAFINAEFADVTQPSTVNNDSSSSSSSSSTAEFGPIAKFIYKLLAHTHIRDTGSIKFLLADKFKDAKLSHDQILQNIDYCLKLKNYVDSILYTHAALDLKNQEDASVKNNTSAFLFKSNSVLGDVSSGSSTSAAAANTTTNTTDKSNNDNNTAANENIDPEISEALVKGSTNVSKANEDDKSGQNTVSEDGNNQNNHNDNNDDKTHNNNDSTSFSDIQAPFSSRVISQAIALSTVGHQPGAMSAFGAFTKDQKNDNSTLLDSHNSDLQQQQQQPYRHNSSSPTSSSTSITAAAAVDGGSQSQPGQIVEQYIPAPPEQSFNTMEEAKEYLKSYMKRTQVGLVVYKSGKNRGYALYRCERGGRPEENIVKRRSALRAPKNKDDNNDDENDDDINADDHSHSHIHSTDGDNSTEVTEVDEHGKSLKKRNRTSKKLDCPFKIHVKLDKKSNQFKLTVPFAEHNHSTSNNNIKNHPILRKRTKEHLEFMKLLYLRGNRKPQILKRKLMERFPDLHVIDKDIYNDVRKIKAEVSKAGEVAPQGNDNSNVSNSNNNNVRNGSKADNASLNKTFYPGNDNLNLSNDNNNANVNNLELKKLSALAELERNEASAAAAAAAAAAINGSNGNPALSSPTTAIPAASTSSNVGNSDSEIRFQKELDAQIASFEQQARSLARESQNQIQNQAQSQSQNYDQSKNQDNGGTKADAELVGSAGDDKSGQLGNADRDTSSDSYQEKQKKHIGDNNSDDRNNNEIAYIDSRLTSS